MGSVVRQFTRESGRTGLAQGKHRVNYGAAVRENMNRLERAADQYKAGVINAQEFAMLWKMQMETAMGATATGINSLAEGLNVMVGLNDQQLGAMKLIAGILQITRAAIGVHRAVLTHRQQRIARLKALAAGETAAYVAAQQYHRPIIATAAVALAAAAGYGAGRFLRAKVDGGEVNLNTPAGQRAALRAFQGAT